MPVASNDIPLAERPAPEFPLDREVFVAPSDIRSCCTLSRHHPRGGITLTVRELLELMMVESDNTAADAVLKLVGEMNLQFSPDSLLG